MTATPKTIIDARLTIDFSREERVDFSSTYDTGKGKFGACPPMEPVKTILGMTVGTPGLAILHFFPFQNSMISLITGTLDVITAARSRRWCQKNTLFRQDQTYNHGTAPNGMSTYPPVSFFRFYGALHPSGEPRSHHRFSFD